SQFKGKEKAIEMNMQAIDEGIAYASENWDIKTDFKAESRPKESETFLIEGNEATALGSIYGGINMLSWYPITPSSSVAEGIIKW
ncbi:MAG: 2-oxoacid:acceptor oxidoreductase subunit alpha, partial [Candidatus Thalassarchaeaceae archaeon]